MAENAPINFHQRTNQIAREITISLSGSLSNQTIWKVGSLNLINVCQLLGKICLRVQGYHSKKPFRNVKVIGYTLLKNRVLILLSVKSGTGPVKKNYSNLANRFCKGLCNIPPERFEVLYLLAKIDVNDDLHYLRRRLRSFKMRNKDATFNQ